MSWAGLFWIVGVLLKFSSLFPNVNYEIRMESAGKHRPRQKQMKITRKQRQNTVLRDTVSDEEHAWDQQK